MSALLLLQHWHCCIQSVDMHVTKYLKAYPVSFCNKLSCVRAFLSEMMDLWMKTLGMTFEVACKFLPISLPFQCMQNHFQELDYALCCPVLGA